MTATLRQATPADQAAEVVRFPGCKLGRPKGSFKPLGKWMRAQITKFKRQGESCIDTFRALSFVEAGDDDGFVISEETGESWRYEVGTNIAGRPVTYEAFRKAWQRLKVF